MSDGVLYQQIEGQWLLYPDQQATRTRHIRFARELQRVQRPVEVQRTTVRVCDGYIKVFGSRQNMPRQDPPQQDDIEATIQSSLDAEWMATTL